MKHLWIVVLAATVVAAGQALVPAGEAGLPEPKLAEVRPAEAPPPEAKPGETKPPPADAPDARPPETAPPRSEPGRARMGIENLKALFSEAQTLVRFQAETVRANPAVAPRLVWEIQGPVVEVIKGKLLPGKMSLHVDSIVRVFDLPRAELEGKEFVAAIKPLTQAADRRFQLVGQMAFPADGPEAEALRKLADTTAEAGAGEQTLALAVRPVGQVFSTSGAQVIEIRLTNSGKDSATYLQNPIAEKDGRLYLIGQGMIRIRDTTGRTLPDKGNIVAGMAPPPPPKPALILPGASLVETVDLAKYYTLPEGRYTLVLILATPDMRGRVPSNGLSFQVGAVNLPEPPEPKKGEPVKIAEPPPEKVEKPAPTPPAPEPKPVKPAEPAIKVPEPSQYKPGKSSAGLSALLRPSKAAYILGDPVDLEFRLINDGPRTLAIDARLERTLTIQVESVADSPQPLVIRQVIPWPADEPGRMPDQRSYLREGAFWGRTINLNALYGKSLAEMPAPTPEEITSGKDLTYERHGKHLFGFPKPGYYNVTATYTVARPPKVDGGNPDPASKEWWIGEVQTNTITIQVAEKAR